MSEDAGSAQDSGAAAESDSGATDLTPPETNGWWNFSSKDDAATWANEIVEKRLARERKKFESVVAEHGTLKAEVEELRPLKAAKQTDTERWESEKQSLAKELEDLRGFKSKAERNDLVRQIAEDKGLPAKFIARVQGDDEDSISSDIDDLLNVLSEDGKSTRKPASRKPQDADNRPPAKGSNGGGSDQDDVTADDIIKKLREKNGGRIGRNPFSLTR